MVSTESVSLSSNGFKLVGKLFLPDSASAAPALLICHGAGHFKESYFELAEYLAGRGIAAFTVDMCGHGESEGPRFHTVIKQWVVDVRAAVDFLSKHSRIDSERIAGFGISSGGTAVLEAALTDPRLRALIAMDATVRNSLPVPMTLILKTFVGLGKIKRALTGKDLKVPLAKMGPLHLASDPEVNAKLVNDPKTMEAFMALPFPGATEAFFVDTIKRVSGIKVPTLVIWGEDDQLDPPETAKLLFAALACKKQLEIIPGNGHAGHVDRNKEKVFGLTADWVLGNLQTAARAAAA
jgi:uncharacterized protein